MATYKEEKLGILLGLEKLHYNSSTSNTNVLCIVNDYNKFLIFKTSRKAVSKSLIIYCQFPFAKIQTAQINKVRYWHKVCFRNI